MGMNNSDFLSDAVALDLGKSGVKVAETLEIEVGDEWWRLINAADVTEGKTFHSRRFVDPVIVGDEIQLNGTLQQQGLAYSYNSQLNSVVGYAGDDKVPVYCFLGLKRPDAYGAYYQLGSWPIIRVQKADGTVLGSEYNPSTTYWYSTRFLFWDSVNTRFIGVTHAYSKYCAVITMSADGASYGISEWHSTVSTPPIDVRSFLEKSGYVYSLFYSGTSLYFKETEIAAGASYLTLGKATVNFNAALCTQVSVAENTGGVGWLFFSRAFNSVGLMWRDSNTGLVKYALQSEAFATAYTFPDLTFGGSKTIESVGNFVIPQEGEFLVVKTNSLPTGTLARPTGWSYPVNFSIIGTAEVAENVGVLLGKVGTTLYRLEINLTTMAITKIWTVVIPQEPGVFTSLIHLTNGLEIYASNAGNPIFCLNTNTESLAWCFCTSDWDSSTLWVTSGTVRGRSFCRTGSENAVFVRTIYSTNYYAYRYFVNLDALANCSSIEEVYTLLQTTGRTAVTLSATSYYKNFFQMTNRSFHSIEDDAYDYLFEHRWLPDGNQFNALRLVKPNGALNGLSVHFSAGFVPGGDSSDIQYSEFLPYGFLAPGHHFSKLDDVEETDGVFVGYFDANNSSSSNYYRVRVNAFGVFSSTGHLSRAAAGPYVGTPTATNTRYASPLNEKYSRMIFNGTGTTLAVDGCSFSSALTTCTACSNRITLPFTYAWGIMGTISQKFYALSIVVDGDISWARFHAREGLERTMYAVRATNLSEIYTIKGLEVSGGWRGANFQGRIITGVTGVGKMVAVDLEASDTEGYDEAGGGGTGEESPYVYQYLDREYIPYPFAREGIRAELSNISKTTKITLPETQDNLIRGMLAAGTDFRGSRCILRRVFPDHIDEPGADIVLLDGYIQDWSYVPGKKGIAFSVSKTLIDVGAQFPKRLMNMGCSHVFKGVRCRYLGEEGRCLKTRAFCTSLSNLNQFGGFPWVAARQRRVMWK